MPSIFISYAHEDQRTADQILSKLEALGLSVWMDCHSISPGQHWDREIHNALTACEVMLLIHSSASFHSNNVWDEWSFFLNRQKIVIPVIVEDVELPYRLERLQYINYLSDQDAAIQQLLNAILDPDLLPPPPTPGGASIRIRPTKNIDLKQQRARRIITFEDTSHSQMILVVIGDDSFLVAWLRLIHSSNHSHTHGGLDYIYGNGGNDFLPLHSKQCDVLSGGFDIRAVLPLSDLSKQQIRARLTSSPIFRAVSDHQVEH